MCSYLTCFLPPFKMIIPNSNGYIYTFVCFESFQPSLPIEKIKTLTSHRIFLMTYSSSVSFFHIRMHKAQHWLLFALPFLQIATFNPKKLSDFQINAEQSSCSRNFLENTNALLFFHSCTVHAYILYKFNESLQSGKTNLRSNS